MSASDSFEALVLQLVFQNANAANIGDATGLRGSTAAGSMYIGLHTADPGETGTQATSEATYTGYARVAVARTSGAFGVTGTAPTTASNSAVITFPACTAGTSVCTHFTIGTAASGVGVLLFSGALTASLSVSAGITPSMAIGALTVTAD